MIPIKAYLAAGLILAVIGGAAWLRWDAVRDDDVKDDLANKDARIKTMEDTKERRSDVENLSDDDLHNSLSRRVRGPH